MGCVLKLMLLLLQNESEDWESMRNWMVWCMHANLDDDDPTMADTATPIPSFSSSKRGLNRQTSLDSTRGLQLNHQDCFEVNNGEGKMSMQSSLESNGET